MKVLDQGFKRNDNKGVILRLFIIFIWVFSLKPSFAGPLSLDLFHLFQDRIVMHYEHPVSRQESLKVGVDRFKASVGEVDLDLTLYELIYRRYGTSTSAGVFYSFGVRSGPVELKSTQKTENEVLIMPFYDVGLKAKFSERWIHELRLEVGFLQLYSDDVDVDRILGLQWTPHFSFGYSVD